MKPFTFRAEIDSEPFTRPPVNTYILAKDRKFREELAWIASLEMKVRKQEMFTDAIKVWIRICRNKRVDTRNFGDVDNHLKNIFDALNGVCWSDDAKIVECKVSKKQVEEPHISIKIEEIEVEKCLENI